MKGKLKDPQLTYALDAMGKMIYIGDVERGLSCNCHCPKCNEPLIAKLGHEGGRQSHFAHKNDSDCRGSYMTALHKLAEQIIEEEKAVMVPAYKEIERQRLSFVQVEVEQRVERKDLQPDIVGITADGLRWFIEIRNTHEVDETKKDKLLESGITCLEIDVREQKLEDLKSFILESAENREWINNSNYDAQITSLAEILPFNRFWTVDEYYENLMSSNTYETKKGHLAEIVECDKVCNVILLLYKAPIEEREITPYHIAVISVDNGNLLRNDVAVFTNQQSAKYSYCERLSKMRVQHADNDLPF